MAAGRWRPTLLLITALAATGCDPRGSTGPTPTQPAPEDAKGYLAILLDTMEAYAINKTSIDWATFRTEVTAVAGTPRTIKDLYSAIDVALRKLNDHESYYRGSDLGVIGLPPVGGCGASASFTARPPDTVGYVKILGSGKGQSAQSIQEAIRAEDRAGLIGWIVDLRENDGGDMWPMIAGVGPILGEGIIGWIVYNNREYEREYRDGAVLSLGEPFARVEDPYVLLKPFPRVAVLTSGLTVSAGEAMTVWFKGRPSTRSFGTPTCGHHHLLQQFGLRDGALLGLVTAQNADRMKVRYRGPIAPDEVVAEPGEVVERAIAWLRGPG